MLWDIDLIFGMWVYNDKLQIKFTFRSSSIIFGRVMALGHEIWPNILLSPLFFTMLGDIDLIFGIWVYNDELQIEFKFHSGSMIFGQVMALGLWNLAKYLVVTTLFHYDLRYWLDFWYESVHKLQINFEICSGWMIFWPTYSHWTLKFGQIFSCHHFINPSPTKLRWDIVTLPSVLPSSHPSFLPSFRKILVNTLESTSFNGFWPNLVHT